MLIRKSKALAATVAMVGALLFPGAAWATIDGFILEGMTEASDDFDLDDRIGTARDEDEHIINIDDCEAYHGYTIDVRWGLDPPPVDGDLYSIKLADPGGSCPVDDLDDEGEEGSCNRILIKRGEPSSSNNSFEVDLDDLTGGDCTVGTDETTTIYVVYQLTDDTFQSQPIDFDIDLEPPVAPTNVEAFAGESSVKVTWDDESNTETGVKYRVYYRANASFESVEEADGYEVSAEEASSATVTGLEANSSYYFRVAAVDENANIGPLSIDGNVVATTVPTTDFYEAYREAGGEDTGGFCFIATAAYGSPLHGHVGVLREFRDRVLLPTSLGREFVATYYELSPPLASAVRDSAWLAAAVRILLVPLVFLAWFALKLGLLGKLAVMAGALFVTRGFRQWRSRRWAQPGPAMRPLPLTVRGGGAE